MVEVTQKQMVTTSMMIHTVKTEVINSTSTKLNSTPFNLKKKPTKNITLLSKAGSQDTIKYVNIIQTINKQSKDKNKDNKVDTPHIFIHKHKMKVNVDMSENSLVA